MARWPDFRNLPKSTRDQRYNSPCKHSPYLKCLICFCGTKLTLRSNPKSHLRKAVCKKCKGEWHLNNGRLYYHPLYPMRRKRSNG